MHPDRRTVLIALVVALTGPNVSAGLIKKRRNEPKENVAVAPAAVDSGPEAASSLQVEGQVLPPRRPTRVHRRSKPVQTIVEVTPPAQSTNPDLVVEYDHTSQGLGR